MARVEILFCLAQPSFHVFHIIIPQIGRPITESIMPQLKPWRTLVKPVFCRTIRCLRPWLQFARRLQPLTVRFLSRPDRNLLYLPPEVLKKQLGFLELGEDLFRLVDFVFVVDASIVEALGEI